LDGRQAAKHERSALAGSGDPKKMKELAELTGRGSAAAHPGQVTSAEFTVKAIASSIEAGPSTSLTAGGPGDKVEAHVSEEELGVTTPLSEKEAAQ
jgi:hypothetical protein